MVTLSIIGFLLYKFDWGELVLQLRRADPVWLAFACVVFGITYLLAAVRWWLLLQVQDIFLRLRVVTALTLIGQFFNNFMLGSVGGDIVKAVYLHRYAPAQRTHATLSVVMDRVLGLFMLLCGSLLAIPWQLHSMMTTDKADTAIVGLLIVFVVMVAGGIAMAVMPFHRAPKRLRQLWSNIPHHRVIELIVSGFRQHGIALRLTLASIGIAVAVTLGLTLAGFCIAVGIGLDVSYPQLLVILTVAICITSLPISIGGHGVREGIFVIMFAAFGVVSTDASVGAGRETAILFSLLFFAIPLVWSMVGGVIYLVFRHDYPGVMSAGGAVKVD